VDRLLDGLFKVFDVLLTTNPLAAILFIMLIGALLALRRYETKNQALQVKHDLILENGPKEKEAALKELQKLHDERIACKDKEIALLHAEYAELNRDTTEVLRTMKGALETSNHRHILRAIHKCVIVIGNKGHNIPITDLGIDLNSDL
jgi:hypothetical protein